MWLALTLLVFDVGDTTGAANTLAEGVNSGVWPQRAGAAATAAKTLQQLLAREATDTLQKSARFSSWQSIDYFRALQAGGVAESPHYTLMASRGSVQLGANGIKALQREAEVANVRLDKGALRAIRGAVAKNGGK